ASTRAPPSGWDARPRSRSSIWWAASTTRSSPCSRACSPCCSRSTAGPPARASRSGWRWRSRSTPSSWPRSCCGSCWRGGAGTRRWSPRRRRRRHPAVARPVARALAATALAAVAAGAAFALTTLAAGLGVGWLGALSVSDRIINYLSVPTAVAHLVHAVTDSGLEDVLSVTRSVGAVLLACVLVVVWATHRRDTPTALRGIVLALVAFFLLNSVSWPWYYVWVAAFWFAARPGRRATTAAVAGTVFLILAIGPDGSTSLYSPVLAAAAVVAALVTAWWWRRRLRTPSPERAS